MAPRMYGERVQTEVSGPNGGAIQLETKKLDPRNMSEEEREVLAKLLRKATGK